MFLFQFELCSHSNCKCFSGDLKNYYWECLCCRCVFVCVNWFFSDPFSQYSLCNHTFRHHNQHNRRTIIHASAPHTLSRTYCLHIDTCMHTDICIHINTKTIMEQTNRMSWFSFSHSLNTKLFSNTHAHTRTHKNKREMRLKKIPK